MDLLNEKAKKVKHRLSRLRMSSIKKTSMPWLEWVVGALSHNQKVVGLIPGQGTYLGCVFGSQAGAYGRQSIDVSLSPLLPISLPL